MVLDQEGQDLTDAANDGDGYRVQSTDWRTEQTHRAEEAATFLAVDDE